MTSPYLLFIESKLDITTDHRLWVVGYYTNITTKTAKLSYCLNQADNEGALAVDSIYVQGPTVTRE